MKQIAIPPSKSVAHRALICAALSGNSMVRNCGENQDVLATLRCIHALGFVTTTKGEGEDRYRFFPRPVQKSLLADCGESGSTLRFFIPIAAALGTPMTFTGKGRLMERPLTPFEDCFKGSDVKLTVRNGQARVSGQLKAGTYQIGGDISSQFLTGLLLALPLLDGESEIVLTSELQSRPYIDITLDVMKKFGVDVRNENYARFVIPATSSYVSTNYIVEADYSSASFFLTAGALGAEVDIVGLRGDSLQGDKFFIPLLEQGGAIISPTEKGITVKQGTHRGFVCDVTQFPDLVPPLALFMALCEGESRIIGASRLRIKESDRLATVTRQLNELGANIKELEDSLIIQGVPKLRGGHVSGCGDHRIAMMCAIASLACEERVTLDDWKCVEKSYPEFWEHFAQIEKNEVIKGTC
ncbi:MAG: 3-phosphoshikimate 1-carboxyvinyltransferase [Eubacteriales bacterium]